jgi:hypothetical protein
MCLSLAKSAIAATVQPDRACALGASITTITMTTKITAEAAVMV